MRTRAWALRALQTGILAAVLVGIYRRLAPELAKLSWADVMKWRPDFVVLLAATVLLLAMYLMHALLWRRITADVTGTRISVGAALRVYFIAGLGRYIPGKVWQVAGFAVLSQRAGLPGVDATAAALLGQVAFMSTGVIFTFALLPAWTGETPVIFAMAGVAFLATLVFTLARTHAGAATRAWVGKTFGERAESALAIADRITPARAAVWTFGYAFTWVVLCCAFLLFVVAFVAAPRAAYAHIAGTVAAAYLAGYLAFFAPAGVGVREAVMSVLLTQVVPVSAALMISIASRVWFTIAELLPLAVVPFTANGREEGNR